MRQFTIEELDDARFDAFSATHPQGNFQQTSRMAKVRRQSGAEVSLLGVSEQGTLVAATSLEVYRSRFSTFAEIHDGPLCDLLDKELCSFFFSELKARAKAAGAAQLSITPELPYQLRDSFGQALPTEEGAAWPAGVPAGAKARPELEAFGCLTSLGFVHEGFVRSYTAVPRWRYVKDLTGIKDEQGLLASYAKNTRRDVRIAENCFVTVEQATREQLGCYHALCELSSEKQGFDNRPLEYFELLFDCLGDAAQFMIAWVDLGAYLASCREKSASFGSKLAQLEATVQAGGASAKNQRRLADCKEQYEGSLKRIKVAEELLAQDGERVAIAAALFVFHPRECIYLFSGSNPAYATFCGASAIQHQAMCECLRRGTTRYNFYGINGVFDDPTDPGRGLLEFKQGFCGYVEELMGSFTLPVRPLTFAAKQLAHRLLGH